MLRCLVIFVIPFVNTLYFFVEKENGNVILSSETPRYT